MHSLVRRLFPPGSRQSLELMRAAWPLAVGKDLARRTEVLAVEGRTLRIRVPDARWRKVLHRMRGDILQRLRGVAGDGAPVRLGLQEDPAGFLLSSAAPDERPAAPVPPAPPPLAVCEAAAAIADEDLRRVFLETAARYLGRQPGKAAPTFSGRWQRP